RPVHPAAPRWPRRPQHHHHRARGEEIEGPDEEDPMKLQTRRRRQPEPATHDAGEQILAGGAVEVGPRFLRVGDGFCATLVVTGYPAEVGAAWLEPLLSWPGRLDLALHIEPLP